MQQQQQQVSLSFAQHQGAIKGDLPLGGNPLLH
jgi:hypothetical protein